jgi:hypothetical protein
MKGITVHYLKSLGSLSQLFVSVADVDSLEPHDHVPW